MEQTKPNQTFALDTRRMKKDKTYPVKLRLIYRLKSRMYGTNVSVTESDFKKLFSKKVVDYLKDTKDELDKTSKRADEIINTLSDFSFSAFAEKWHQKNQSNGNPDDVFVSFQLYIDKLERENRIGSAITYRCALTSLKKFTNRESLNFDEITVDFLKRYEMYMKSTGKEVKKKNKAIRYEGNSLTTIGIYLRCLRAIYNLHYTVKNPEQYPFRKTNDTQHNKYSIPAPQGRKRALPIKDIKKIFDYTPANDVEAMYRDLWIFSYLCNGANIKDVCLLKFRNIKGDSISFIRAKTVNTDREPKTISAAYTDHLKAIVSRWGNQSTEPNEFIFPFLKHSYKEKQIKECVAEVVKRVNKYIKRVALTQGIKENITTYTARVTYASTLRNAGVNVSFISENMGHSDIKTTEIYLNSIEDDKRKEIAAELTKF